MTLREKLDTLTITELKSLREWVEKALGVEFARRKALRRFSLLVADALRRKRDKH